LQAGSRSRDNKGGTTSLLVLCSRATQPTPVDSNAIGREDHVKERYPARIQHLHALIQVNKIRPNQLPCWLPHCHIRILQRANLEWLGGIDLRSAGNRGISGTSALLNRTSRLREDIVRVGADQPDRPHHNYQNHRQHYRILRDVLALFVPKHVENREYHLEPSLIIDFCLRSKCGRSVRQAYKRTSDRTMAQSFFVEPLSSQYRFTQSTRGLPRQDCALSFLELPESLPRLSIANRTRRPNAKLLEPKCVGPIRILNRSFHLSFHDITADFDEGSRAHSVTDQSNLPLPGERIPTRRRSWQTITASRPRIDLHLFT